MSIFGKRNNVITYKVNKAINSDMYITVQNGEVVVNAPWYFTSNKIQEIIKEKKNWILEQIEEEKKSLPNMRNVKIFGKNYDIEVVYKNVKTPELNLQEDYTIEIILPNKYKKVGNEQILKMSIEKMYEQIANAQIENLMERVRIMTGMAPEEYSISKLENNVLGKCLDNKMIIINPELFQFKREIIEYVIIHEFCHLKYKSHGKRFLEMVQKYVPKYKKYDNEIQGYEI